MTARERTVCAQNAPLAPEGYIICWGRIRYFCCSETALRHFATGGNRLRRNYEQLNAPLGAKLLKHGGSPGTQKAGISETPRISMISERHAKRAKKSGKPRKCRK